MTQIPIDNLYIKKTFVCAGNNKNFQALIEILPGNKLKCYKVNNKRTRFISFKNGFFGRKPKQHIYSKGCNQELLCTYEEKHIKLCKVNLFFYVYIITNIKYKKDIFFFLEFSLVRSSCHRYKKMVTFISGPV